MTAPALQRDRPRIGARPAGLALATLLLLSVVMVLGVGSVSVEARDVVHVVARRLHLVDGASVGVLEDQIVWQLRLPRVLAAAAVGAVLALSGAVMQSLLTNELADPFLLGISSGAAFGAVLALTFGVTVMGTGLGVGVAAMLGAVVALGLVLALATSRSGALPPVRTILAGVAVAQLSGAGTSMLIMVFGSRDTARQVLAWTLGSFAGVRTRHAVVLVAVALLVVLCVLAAARTLDAFAFGETAARSVGVDVRRITWVLLVGSALAAAATVGVVGPIGFVGLVVPHLVRLVVGPGHRRLLPLAALTGALLMVWADTAARSLAPDREIPVGVVTAIVGAPVLIALLRRQARTS
ncbi:FecCD family ABC transporter permease [Ornithinimicrobium pratense]|uniref:Iron chelate uptake ABC transporter family permease subunit n=1 Tax=Ornithinimicrobium pratense TaxID=2593973 RepID=A0A5J6V7D8_9MICO|nr:iron chelate uptake ABC transporter family permease subunit [Ornithinimicrobium pratense]QFG69467.1 iron chelate uptake ABC transporter family permease subunit [Ornithinimicrobium pratense]